MPDARRRVTGSQAPSYRCPLSRGRSPSTFDRATAHVTVVARVTVRTMVIEDPQSGTKVELEGDRVWSKHSKEVIHALVGDSEVEESEEPEEAEDANA